MNRRIVALCLIAAASFAGCTRSRPSSPPPPTASPPAAPVITPAPRATTAPATAPPAPSTAAPVSSPTLPPTATPSPRPTPTPQMLPPDAAPKIVSIEISETTVHSGDTVSGTVVTSSNVASVEVRVAGYSASLPKIGVGRFALNYRLGSLPFFVHGTYDMQVIARNARGDSARQSLPITVR